MADRHNLFFFTHERQTDDFRAVARRIVDRARDVAPYVFGTRDRVRPALASAALMFHPTVSIEMDRRRQRFRIFRGARLAHRGTGGKVPESRLLEAHGLPLPKWTEILPDTVLSPGEWGSYVVVKPSRGSHGAYVWIHRTGRVRFKPPSGFPEGHPGRRGPMIAQKFIYTGRWPVAYRVLTYFGRPLMAIRYEGREDIAPLETRYGFRENGGRSIVATAKGCRISLIDDPDVIELACRTHTAVPEIPSLGIDIVREHETGMLYLIEINAGGGSWLLTGEAGKAMQAQFGLDFYSQFHALDVIADRSIEIAREHAR